MPGMWNVVSIRKDVSRMLEKLLGIEMDFAINDAVPCLDSSLWNMCATYIYIYTYVYNIYFSYHWGEVSFYINSPLSCFSSDPGLCAFGQIAPRRNPRSRTPGVKRPTHIHMSRTCSSRASSLGMCTSEDINRLWWVWQFVFVFVVVVAFVLVLVLLLLVKKIINPIEWAAWSWGWGLPWNSSSSSPQNHQI